MNGHRQGGRKKFPEFPERAKKKQQTAGSFANPLKGRPFDWRSL